MVKTKITETTEKYDKDGKLVEKIIREETSEDDTTCSFDCKPNVDYEEISRAFCRHNKDLAYFPFCF